MDETNTDNPIIRIEDVSFGYPGGEQVLDHVGLCLMPGQKIGLIGANGSGKTTLFHIIMGLLKPMEGVVKIFGKAVKQDKDFEKVYQKIP